MINFILVSHGQMAEGILNAAELICGKNDGVQVISLNEGDSIDELGQRIENTILDFQPVCDGTVIMVDLFGASPFNQAAMVAMKYDNIDVVTGLNLPMLLESIMLRKNLPLSEMVALAKKCGMDGIKVFSDMAE
jgi:PTS system mannose-specific IIA component